MLLRSISSKYLPSFAKAQGLLTSRFVSTVPFVLLGQYFKCSVLVSEVVQKTNKMAIGQRALCIFSYKAKNGMHEKARVHSRAFN